VPSAWFPQPDEPQQHRVEGFTSRAVHESTGHGRVVIQLDADGVWARRVTWYERLQSHLCGDRLDRALAAGVPPETDPLLALRAAQISSPKSRSELASLVRRILSSALTPDDSPFRARSMAILPRVRKAQREFETLVERLEAPVPLPARGMAAVKLLLRDGAGPLYRYESRQSLPRLVRDITDLLDPSLDWTLG